MRMALCQLQSTVRKHTLTSTCPSILTILYRTRCPLLGPSSPRAEKVCSTVGERDDERKHVTDALRANGYPMNIIEMNAQSRQRPS